MERGRWAQIDAVFQHAADLSEPQREAYLEAQPLEVAVEVRRLLRSLPAAPDYLWQVVDSAWADDTAGDAGQMLGPYRLIREIGRGGMGTVWLADRADGQFEQQVAVKLIRGGMDHEEIVRRFLAERQILARLNHRHIARLIDGGATAEGRPYLVMEYVEGLPLPAYCREQKATRRERLELFRTICAAVQHAHSNLIIHRDLKPGNVLVTAGGETKLLDFGIAKLLDESAAQDQTQLRILTPAYASPEQRHGAALTTATDIYSLGVILRELLADGAEGAGADLNAVVAKATREEPQHRYATAGQMGDDIARYLNAYPVLARQGTLRYRARKFARRNRWAVLASAAAMVALGGFLMQVWLDKRRIQSERDRYRVVTNVLEGIFSGADPNRTNRPLTVRELLDRSIVRVRRQVIDPDSRAELEHTIAGAYISLGAYEPALAIFGPLAQRLRRMPAQRARLTDVLSETAFTLASLSRHREAEAAAAEAAEVARRDLPASEVRLASAYNHLCGARASMAHYDAAEQACRQALELYDRHPDKRREQRAGVLNLLGHIAVGRKRMAEAERFYSECLAAYRRMYQPPHARIASALRTLGNAYVESGRPEQGEALLRDAMAMLRVLFPEGHQQVAHTLDTLAVALIAQHKLDEAEPLLREAHQIMRRAQGETGVWLAYSYGRLGQVHASKGRYTAAEELLRKALDLCAAAKAGCGPARASFAYTLVESGRPQRGLEMAREAVKLKITEADRGFARSVEALGLVRLRQAAEAEAVAREALAEMGGDWRAVYGQLALARALAAQRKPAEPAVCADLRKAAGRIHGSVRSDACSQASAMRASRRTVSVDTPRASAVSWADMPAK